MNAPIKDLYRRHPTRASGKQRYIAAREAGLGRVEAATVAGITLDYAANLYSQSLGEAVISLANSSSDDAYVEKLVALGGFPRLSEKLKRKGHVACLPLIQFEARP